MAKFHGVIGYSAGSVEIVPGSWEETFVEYTYNGDVIRNTRRIQESQSINPDLTVQNSISIVADAYAREHFFAMRYVAWMGTLWLIESVEVQSPRLVLRLGGVYNGPVAPPGDPGDDG